MTYARAIEIALQKIDAESSDYNDDIFPAIIDEAQKLIATQGRHIKKMYTIVKTADDETEYVLPTLITAFKFYELNNIRLRGSNDPVDYYTHGEGAGFTVVITGTGTFDLYCYAMPSTVDSNTLDTYEFEVDEETQVAIPFYIAYELTKSDDVTMAQIMLNEWNKYLSLFKDRPKAEKRQIINKYELRC